MAIATQPTTFLDLIRDLLNRTRQDTGSSPTTDQAKRYVNTALYDMHIGYGERFPWTERRDTLLTHPVYTDGTVTVPQGGLTVTGIATLFDTNNALSQSNARVGGKIRIDGQREHYRVEAVPNDTSLTIDSRFIGETILADPASYTYFEDEYDLPSPFLRPIDLHRFTDGPDPIALVSRTEFRRRLEGVFVTGRPRIATLLDLTAAESSGAATAPVRKVRFHPIPDKAYQLTYSYVSSNLAVDSSGAEQAQLVADTDEPIVPLRYRHVIVLHALYHWYRDKKDDTRSVEAKGEYVDLLTRITGDNEIGSPKPSISPRKGAYTSRARRPWGRGLGRFDTGGRFDRIEDL